MGWIILIIVVIVLAILFRGAGSSLPVGKEQRMLITEIELVGFRLLPPCAFSHRIAGKVINRSTEHTLTEMALEITLLDYADGNIIEQRDKVIWLDVPPGQARDIVEYVDLSSTRQTFGTIPWRYRIIYAKGR
ncbi:MAG: hypothetical protein LWX55_05840 [Deltaproteobacteria bacterium]|jgi:hypothetical protein|nr:hypothetical protein [Deltaproteobacteria bacterium]